MTDLKVGGFPEDVAVGDGLEDHLDGEDDREDVVTDG